MCLCARVSVCLCAQGCWCVFVRNGGDVCLCARVSVLFSSPSRVALPSPAMRCVGALVAAVLRSSCVCVLCVCGSSLSSASCAVVLLHSSCVSLPQDYLALRVCCCAAVACVLLHCCCVYPLVSISCSPHALSSHLLWSHWLS